MAVPCVKNYYGRTYSDEFMPTCLRGANFFETQCQYTMCQIWVHKKYSGIKSSMKKMRKSFVFLEAVQISEYVLYRTNVNIGDGASLEFMDQFGYVGEMLSANGDAEAAMEVRV